MFGLIYLPYEVLANIVGQVDFDDIFSLGLTCKALNYLLTEESIAKVLMEVKYHPISHVLFKSSFLS